jgi:DNA (cytosine-5)-methyltransferase 1
MTKCMHEARLKEVNVSPTLHAKSDNTCDLPVVLQPAMAVRRLTPTECERLQGFPDGYTQIPWRKKDEAPDSLRYKALGNSMAVPVMRWIGERINQINNKEQ